MPLSNYIYRKKEIDKQRERKFYIYIPNMNKRMKEA